MTLKKEDVIFPEEGSLKYYYEPKPNSIDNKKRAWLPDGYDYAITINADSLNERFDYSSDKPQDVFRIITLGDSFTHGAYVNTKDNYPERLEDMLNENFACKTIKKFEVINLGFGGYDIEYAVHRFKEKGQKYSPELILWFIKNDDFSVINELIRHKIDQYREEIGSNLTLLDQLQSEGNFYPWSQKVSQELKEELGKEGLLEYSKNALWGMRDYYRGKLVFITFSGKEALKDSRYAILDGFAKERGDIFMMDSLFLTINLRIMHIQQEEDTHRLPLRFLII